MSDTDTLTEAPAFVAPEAVHYTDSKGNVRIALVLEAQDGETPAKLRVIRSNGTTSIRNAVLDTESGTYRKAADPIPAIPEVVAYADRNGSIRPALVQTAETESAPASVLVVRNNGMTYTRNARKNPDTGNYLKVSDFWSGYADENEDGSEDEDL